MKDDKVKIIKNITSNNSTKLEGKISGKQNGKNNGSQLEEKLAFTKK